MLNIIKSVLKSNLIYIPIIIFFGFTCWWILLLDPKTTDDAKQLWAALYQIMAIYGGFIGIYISMKWGGWKSIIGRAILFFSLGLFLQSFGQIVYSYYIYFAQIDIPYPSIGDIGFFGAIPAYIYGVWLLAKASGVKISLKSFENKIQAFIIPLAMLVLSYFAFLDEYEFDWSNPLVVLLDFGYPLGQAIYVSIAVLILLLSIKRLKGIMKSSIFFLVIALISQYISDYMFLYQASRGTWQVGGLNDYSYLVSYVLMTLAIIHIDEIFKKIRES